jgi:hypothetical protein
MGRLAPGVETVPGCYGPVGLAGAGARAASTFQFPVPKDKEINIHVGAISNVA